MGIEPTSPAWKAGALPLCYARIHPCRATLYQWFCPVKGEGRLTTRNSHIQDNQQGLERILLDAAGRHHSIGHPMQNLLIGGTNCGENPAELGVSPTTK